MENELIILLEKFLHKRANIEEIIRLKELFNQAEARKILSELYEEKWEQAPLSGSDEEMSKRLWSKIEEQINTDVVTKQVPLWKKGLRIAASILIPLFCVWLCYDYCKNQTAQSSEPVTVQAERGEKASIQLADGTHIWLNSSTSLHYDDSYNKKERIVYLQGEAYFEVKQDNKRPFIVKANGISVEALGTSFNVKAYPDDNTITTFLVEGCVQVSSSLQSDVLALNERLVFSKDDGRFTKSLLPDAQINTSWRNNQLVCEQERLEDIAKMLKRMHNVHVNFASEDLRDIHFSGKIKDNDIKSILQSIAFVSPIGYSIETDSTVVIYNKQQNNR